jgi:sulfur carrier protein
LEPDAVSTAEGKSEGTLLRTHFLKFNTSTGMEISINNQLKTLTGQEQLTVQELLHLELPGKQQGLAVAINNQVIAKANWNDTRIRDKDQVIIIRATQGG